MSAPISLASRRRLLVANLINAAWDWVRQAGLVTAGTRAGRRFAAFGPGSLMAFPTGTIFGERWIRIGDRTMIGEQVTLSAGLMPGHDLGSEPVLRIGDRCVIGRGSHIVAHCSIDIGDDVFTGPYVYITDQNHSYTDTELPIGLQWPVNSAVSIGSGCWLGTGVVILPGAAIGRNVVVAAGSVVRGSIPDHSVIAGSPARVVRDYRPETGWSRVVRDLPSALAPRSCGTKDSPLSARATRSADLASAASRLPSLRYAASTASTAAGGRCWPSSDRAVR